MKQMIALWSMVKLHGLMVAGPGLKPKLARCSNRKTIVCTTFSKLARCSATNQLRSTRAHELDREQKMDEARAVVADFCEKNPYLLGALPMTWFGCGPFARIRPAPAWAVYAMLVVWYGAALVLNGTFRSALVQDLGARGAKEAIAAEARMKMGL